MIVYSTKTHNTSINVIGWKTVQTTAKFTIKSNGKMVNIRCNQSSNTTNVGTEYDIGTLPTGYRPQNTITVPLNSIGEDGQSFGYIRCYADGSIKLKISRSTYSSSGGLTLYGTVEFGI